MTNGLVYLRVKGKSLADEARIIRKEEDRERRKPVESRRPGLLEGLMDHRRSVVRRAARATRLAVAFIKDIPYKKVEPCSANRDIGVERIASMVRTYGGRDHFGKPIAEIIKQIRDWRDGKAQIVG